MSVVSGVALREFQRKYFGSLKSFGLTRRPPEPSRKTRSSIDPDAYDRFLEEEDLARRQRLLRGNRQIRLFILLLTILPIFAFILACLR